MTLNKEALEVARKAGEDFHAQDTGPVVWAGEAVIQAFLSHPDSGYVPRSELDEREDQFDGLVHDRNEAHEDNVRWRADLTTCVTSLGETRAQVAALQKVLSRLINKVNELEWPADPLIECKHGIAPVQGWLNIHSLKGCIEQALAALTNTTEAAAQYQRVPKGFMVVPVSAIHSAVKLGRDFYRESGISPCLYPDWLRELGVYADNALAAAAPKAGEPVKIPFNVNLDDLAEDQKAYINKIIDDQEKGYDPTVVIGGPQAGEPEPEDEG